MSSEFRIPFNRAMYSKNAMEYVCNVIRKGAIAGDGNYTKLCSAWMENKFSANRVLMTSSCTAALEMAALLLEIKHGDEIIMPSYTFVSTANAFVLRGATPVFVDIRPDTMNVDENLIEAAITKKTKAIVVVHYGGVSCDMDKILALSDAYGIPIVEDAAQGFMSTYNGKYLGVLGTFGCYSFHETKNYTMGEGGALVINDEKYIERAEILREKGTNRSKFYRGEIDKYSWIDLGSSYLPSEINAAYLYGQLLMAEEINENRLGLWKLYKEKLQIKEKKGKMDLMRVPPGCRLNGHLFYIKVRNLIERTKLISLLRKDGIGAVFHYVPLHSSEMGMKCGRFSGKDKYTTHEAERLLRLPMFFGLKKEGLSYIVQRVLYHLEEFS